MWKDLDTYVTEIKKKKAAYLSVEKITFLSTPTIEKVFIGKNSL
jgi:hypothetical protein